MFCARQFLEHGWQGEAQGAAEGIDGRPRCDAEQRPAAVLFDLDLAQVREVVAADRLTSIVRSARVAALRVPRLRQRWRVIPIKASAINTRPVRRRLYGDRVRGLNRFSRVCR